MKQHWLKMYDTAGVVLRVETGSNQPEEFRVRRRVRRRGRRRTEYQLFTALMSGEHAVHGFTNRDLRDKLTATSIRLNPDPKRQNAQISRLLSRLHVYGLVAKIPRSRRWRVTAFGHRVMSASVRLRQLHFPTFYAAAA